MRRRGGSQVEPLRLYQLVVMLFTEAARIRDTDTMPDIRAFQEYLIKHFSELQHRVLASGIAESQWDKARYALCTLLDEAVSDTGWGAGVWARNSLLMHFYGENHGGERFFSLLEQIELDLPREQQLAEVFYLCLALGLEGRYRIQPDGNTQLESIRRRLYLTLNERRVHESEPRKRFFSRFWRNRTIVLGTLSLLVFSVSCISLAYFQTALEHQHQRLQKLAIKENQPNWAQQLADTEAADIRSGALQLVKKDDGVRVILSSGAYFASGSADISAAQRELLQRLGNSIQRLPVSVRVIGHSDNLASGHKWRSNQVLSLARARTVMKALTLPLRFTVTAEGRGSSEPLVANDNADNRARNRRVDIFITPLNLVSR